MVISNQVRKAYIDAIVEGQQQNNLSPLLELFVDAAQQSLIEMPHILSTARESRGRGFPLYEEMLAFLRERY